MCYDTVLKASEYGQVIDSEYDCDFYDERDDTMNHEPLFSRSSCVWGQCVGGRGRLCVAAPDCSLQSRQVWFLFMQDSAHRQLLFWWPNEGTLQLSWTLFERLRCYLGNVGEGLLLPCGNLWTKDTTVWMQHRFVTHGVESRRKWEIIPLPYFLNAKITLTFCLNQRSDFRSHAGMCCCKCFTVCFWDLRVTRLLFDGRRRRYRRAKPFSRLTWHNLFFINHNGEKVQRWTVPFQPLSHVPNVPKPNLKERMYE